jgi:hypothetical protein
VDTKGDSDLVPALQLVRRRFPEKEIIVYVPARNREGFAYELRVEDGRTLRNVMIVPSRFLRLDNQMNAIELIGDVDDQHRLHVQVPTGVPAGQVRVIVLVPDEDEAGTLWPNGIAREWSSELSDPREDLYTLDDGRPVNAGG